ncbi:ABC transporter ATP-binding protein/permease [Anaerotignum sp.]|uniref:ABC transporter ATP-binding protein/permease n=1 Tax=Anaerotignum sp. TaxID=2039241 RepID=UPI00289A17E6|nr:ABC transporter ATP-binding protein/permease [Anaerotignum sp.]
MFHKRLLELAPNIKKYIVATVLLQWFGLICNIFIMLSICVLIDSTYQNRTIDMSLAQKTGGIIILFGILRFLANLFSSKTAFQSSKNVKSLLREKIYTKLTQIGTSYKDKISTAEVVQISTEGVNQLEIYFSQYLPQLFYSLIAPITLFFVLSTICFKASVVLLLCVPFIPLSIIAVQKFAKKLLSKYWTAYTDLGDSFLENLQGMTTLKIYQADEMKQKEMNGNAETFRKITMKVLSMQLNSISVMDMVAYGGAAMGILLAVLEFSHDKIGLFQTMAIILLSAEFFIPLRLLGSFFHIAMNGMAAADKIFTVLDTPISQKGTETIEGLDILLENVSFQYENEKKILQNTSLKIPKNTFISLVGKSGCGKSTLAGLLKGALMDYKGSIQIGGIELKRLSEKSLMESITFVNHNSYLFQGTIAYNLRMAKPDATDEELYSVLHRVNFLDFIQNEKGLETPIAEQGSNLSGGQRQRLALARALLHNTPIYIFDEATSNIDAESEAYIMKAIEQLTKTKTVILISHRLANVVNANCIYVLDEGRILQNGTHNELMETHSLYSQLFNQQKSLEEYGKGGAQYA